MNKNLYQLGALVLLSSCMDDKALLADFHEQRKTILYILLIITLIAALLFYHLYRRFREKKREIEKLSHQYLYVLTQYEQAKEEMNMLERDYATFRQRKQEELADLQVQLSEFQSRYGSLRQKEKLEALKQSPIWEAIIERLNPKKKSKPVTDKEWEKLSMLFDQCVPALHALMTEKKPLNWYEQRVAMLTRLGLSAKEIALLLDTFPQRVTNARESANNKLFSDTSARTFMENISKL